MRTILLFLTLGLFTTLSAQRDCGTMEHLEHQLQQDPKLEQKMQQIELQTRVFAQQQANQRAVNGTITIPVVVHVVYNTTAENISAAQIQTQLDVLNEDFRRLNSDANGTWPQAADAEIEFCLASVDPQGNATSGITRTQTSQTSFGTDDQVKFTSSGGKDAWPASDYLNIWVCDISGGILGYAQFPGGNPATDGVVNDYQYFGTIGTATPPFNLGRTMTHEVGHYLNLRHIWGDGGCSVDDFVADTPTSDAPNYGCASSEVSCGSTDMVQNYMDYSDDACMNLYTQGQKSRMRAIFEPGGPRASLLNSSACGAPPTPTCGDGIQNGNETGVDCGGPDCPACPPCTDVTVSITLDNYPEETSWSITNSGGQVVASGGTYASQPDGSTVTSTPCLVDGCYTFTINDAYGDGICCAYGNGSYTVTDANGTVVASGGSFTSSESTNFCLSGGPTPTCSDGIQNGNETGVDCGGADCAPCATCNDGIQNQGETGVDCGGPCTPCATCNDGVQNGDETGVDCGGADCAPCASCNDGIQNQGETGVDCGGPCAPCVSCNDGVQNGDETGVDCGGSNCLACPTGCQDNVATLNIVLDNYPEETSWSITDANGSTVASGGTYGSQPDGSTVTEDLCLGDGCYTFTINDAFGDGICCAYGNGSYNLTAADGSVLASGGSFSSSESTNFCVGGVSGPTCSDGIQNGSETGVDCGGPDCAPCGGGGCTTVLIDDESFEGGFGIWNDGGSDCARVSSATFASSGTVSVRLRDNTSSSVMTTDDLALSNYEEVTIDFSYYPNSMETGEDFWLQASTNGGGTYSTLVTWASGTDFNNNTRYNESVTVTGTFTSNTRFRFRCDASSNADLVYIDDVVISGCANTSRQAAPESGLAGSLTVDGKTGEAVSAVSIAPNPTRDLLTISYSLPKGQSSVTAQLTDLTGRVVMQQQWPTAAGTHRQMLDLDGEVAGVYLLRLITAEGQQTFKVVKVD